MNKKEYFWFKIIIIVLGISGALSTIIGYNAGYDNGNDDNESYFTLPSVCDQIDEFCGVKGIQEYARYCIEEKERIISKWNHTGDGPCDQTQCITYGYAYNETVKEIWDTCTGERIG